MARRLPKPTALGALSVVAAIVVTAVLSAWLRHLLYDHVRSESQA